MVNEPHVNILLPDRTYQAIARSGIKKIAQEIGFRKNKLAQLEIIVAEITSNLVKHANKGGQILVKKLEGDNKGIELISIDEGPGMDTPLKMIEDGISTSKTLGQGLGAIKRISHEFDLYSLKNWGTILLSRFYLGEKKLNTKSIVECKVVMIAKDGEDECGDGWNAIIKGTSLKFILTDGLGHGEQANIAAQKAVEVFNDNHKLSPNELIRLMHTEIKKTRGAVVNISYVDFKNKQITYSGVGNITSKIISHQKNKTCISYNGIVGHTIPNTIHNHIYSLDSNDMLILSSDGISSRWDIAKYPMINKHDGTIIAAALYKDFTRKNDDVSIAVIRSLKNNV